MTSAPRPSVSVVVPLFRNATTVDELLDRLRAATPEGTEIVLVDDACPERSGDRARRDGSGPGVLLRLGRNVGQHAALLIGLRAASGERVVVMDGDLQDRPEDVPLLLDALETEAPRVGAVAAGRRGSYTTSARARSARVFRRVLYLLSRRRIPTDAGMFLAMTATTREEVLELGDPRVPLVPALARAGLEVRSIPVDRQPRPSGASSYRRFARLDVATRSLTTLSPVYPWARSRRRRRWTEPEIEIVPLAHDGEDEPAATRVLAGAVATQSSEGRSRSVHNADQVDYFTGRDLPRMDARTRAGTPYTLRQLDAVVRAGGIRPGERVLDVGCGPGKYTLGLADRGLAVEGLDLTPALIGDLRRVAPEIPAHVADVADPPAELTGRFDAVTGFFVLHHVPDLRATFAGVRRVLRPGGRAVFLEPNPLFLGYYLQIALTPGMRWRHERGIASMRLETLAAAARTTGMGSVEVERFGAFPPVLANRAAGRRVEALLEAIPGWEAVRAFQLFVLSAS